MTSNATETPYSIPVQFRVTPTYSAVARRTGQILGLAGVTGIAGLFAGWLWGAYAMTRITATWSGLFSVPLGWALLAGLLWAIGGVFYGVRTDARRISAGGLLRWLLHLIAWSAGLFLLAGGLVWFLAGKTGGAAGEQWLPAALAVGLTGAVLAIVPALMFKFPAAGFGDSGVRNDRMNPQQRRKRLLYLGIAGAAALSIVFMAARWTTLYPQVQHAESWWMDRAGEFEGRLDRWTDTMIYRYYDRRAPALPTLMPTATPKAESDRGEIGRSVP